MSVQLSSWLSFVRTGKAVHPVRVDPKGRGRVNEHGPVVAGLDPRRRLDRRRVGEACGRKGKIRSRRDKAYQCELEKKRQQPAAVQQPIVPSSGTITATTTTN
jgi:hypothetical protein